MDHQTFGLNVGETPLANARVKSASGATLHGWEGIEEHLMNNDEGRMKGYSEDIDNLLFFAGLFSAILTAFAQQSYQLLQPDSMETTNQLLAYSLSDQAMASPANRRVLAKLTRILAAEDSFTPCTSARWINALFFISLVLSLAAALLGILAKQWLREYMHWNSPLALPRENILVREMRFEAWQMWNVAATISAIPALLEVAMILFLIGMVTLLWTLDDVVAIAVTVVAAAFLLLVAVFTVLPVFSHRCPYKSPTAWALVTAFHVLAVFAVWVTNNMRVLWRRWRRLASAHREWSFRKIFKEVVRSDSMSERDYQFVLWPSALPTSWRERDLKTCRATEVRVGEWWSRRVDALPSAKLELAKEKIHLGQDGELMDAPRPDEVPDEAARELVTTVTETAFLLRALSWVQRSSQDVRVGTYIAQAVESIRRDTSKDAAARWSSGIYATANWCIIASLQDGTIYQPHLALFHGKVGHSRISITDVRAGLNVSMAGDQLRVPSSDGKSWLEARRARGSADGVHAMLARMLAVDFNRFSTDVTGPDSTLRVRRMMELYAVVSEHDVSVPSPVTEHTWAGLRPLVHAQPRSCPAGARSLIFYMACQLSRVTVDAESKKLFTCRGSTQLKDYEKLLLHYFDSDPQSWSVDMLDMFVHAASGWLHKQKFLPPSDEVSRIIRKMILASDALLQRASRHLHGVRHVNDEEWLYGLSVHMHKELSPAHRPPLRTLLHTFEKLFLRDALLGDPSRMSAYLHDAMHTLHNDITKCKDEHCRWASHSCETSEDYLDCPLLRKPGSADIGPLSSESDAAAIDEEVADLFKDWAGSGEHLPPSISRAPSGDSDGAGSQARSASLASRLRLFDSPSQSVDASSGLWRSNASAALQESPLASRTGTRRLTEPTSPPIRAACLALQDSGDMFDESRLASPNLRDAAELFAPDGPPDEQQEDVPLAPYEGGLLGLRRPKGLDGGQQLGYDDRTRLDTSSVK